MRSTLSVLVLSAIVIMFLVGGALAAPTTSEPAGGALAKAASQAAPKEAPAGGSATAGERINALEKENIILRERPGQGATGHTNPARGRGQAPGGGRRQTPEAARRG